MEKHKLRHISSFIGNALKEDVGDGDHTSLACIPSSKKAKAKLLMKENGIIAGVGLAVIIFRKTDKTLSCKVLKEDGSVVKKGDIILTVEGKAQSILKAERVALNCMQRMSGIATATHRLVQLCKGTGAKVIDTRKTTPGFRLFEKWAVEIGGGANHRFGLYDMMLIKDNHIDYAGGVKKAIDNARNYLKRKKKKLKIEIETRNLEEVKEALDAGHVHRIMLDNFSTADLKKALRLIGGNYETEASGGITEKNIRKYARCGVNYISVGALTHSIKSLDMSLKAVK